MSRLFILILFLQLFSLASQGQRQSVSFNNSWKFLREDARDFQQVVIDEKPWKPVNLPHTWNDKDAHDDERGYYQGIGCYRKFFNIPASWKGKRIFIHFEGANHTSETWINSQLLGKHQGGYTAFTYDITDKVKPGQNLLAVKVSNAAELTVAPISADFTFYGGIYRDVYLVATDQVYFDGTKDGSKGLWISYPKVSEKTAQMQVKTRISNKNIGQAKVVVQYELLDADRKQVLQKSSGIALKAGATSESSFNIPEIKNPKLWSPSKPYLYTLRTTLLVDKKPIDALEQPVGFRWYRFSADSGFFLNGKPLKLVGTCRHQDFKGLGNALPDDYHRQDIQLLKEMGANFLRIAHYPQDNALLEACDKEGILAWEEVPVVNTIIVDSVFYRTTLSQLKEMIRQHQNHPSIIIWGSMNEVLLSVYRKGEKEFWETIAPETNKLAKKMDSLMKAEDPGRYTAMAFHHSENYNKAGLGEVHDIVGWNLYHGWYHDTFTDFGPYLDKEHAKYPKRVHIISEYGAGSDRRVHSVNPQIYDFTPEWQQAYHESYLKQIMERPYIAGFALWNLVDFGSEGRKETMPQVNNKGLLETDRRKKDVFYFYKAALNPQPMAYIAVRDYSLRVAYNPPNNTLIRQEIKVYTNLPELELFINGKSVGVKKPDFHRAVFFVDLVAGKNYVDVVGTGNNMMTNDHAEIELKTIPVISSSAFNELKVNVGSHCSYTEEDLNTAWLADQDYSATAGWGSIGGKPLMNFKRKGTQAFVQLTRHQPLFQTQRDSIQGFKADVGPGKYEVELGIAELNEKLKATATIVNDIGGTATSDAQSGPSRLFDIILNGTMIVEDMDPILQLGVLKAGLIKSTVSVQNNEGIELKFISKMGKPILNTIRITRIQ